jgi:hypothetical protein
MAVQLENFPPSLGTAAAQGDNFMLIDSYESSNAITTGSTKISSVSLYIPAGALKTEYTGKYEVKEGGATQARLGRGNDSAYSKIEGASDQATALATSFLDKGGIMSASGASPNKYQALVYQGPAGFRTHPFAFKFFPRNSDEAATVQRIIRIFKKGTLPRARGELAAGGDSLRSAYFKSPHHHKITFYKGGTKNSNLFHIGTSVITAMSVNYDPQTMVGFHADGQPVGIDLSLTFQEIEIQISEDLVTGGADLSAQVEATVQNQQSAQNAGSSALVDGQIQFNPNTGRIVGGL